MPLFGRKQAEPQQAEPQLPAAEPVEHLALVAVGPTGDLECMHPECNRRDGVLCSYRDRRGNGCETQWCPDHYGLVDGAPYCRRHVSVARALTRHTAAHAVAPDLGNRAPSLCEWVAAAITGRVEDILKRAASARPGSAVVVEPLELVLEGTPRMRYWERSWKLLDHTGPLAKLVIRVGEEDDRTAIAIVARAHLVEIVPPWVDRRVTDDAGRESFYASIVAALSEGLENYLEASEAAARGFLPG